jgi:cell division protein FtsL
MSKGDNTKQMKSLFKSLFDIEIKITKENVPRLLTFVLFVSSLMIFYIGNKYYSEKQVMKIDTMNKEIKELRAESITTKAELMNYSKLSEIMKRANELGLYELKDPPRKVSGLE